MSLLPQPGVMMTTSPSSLWQVRLTAQTGATALTRLSQLIFPKKVSLLGFKKLVTESFSNRHI